MGHWFRNLIFLVLFRKFRCTASLSSITGIDKKVKNIRIRICKEKIQSNHKVCVLGGGGGGGGGGGRGWKGPVEYFLVFLSIL